MCRRNPDILHFIKLRSSEKPLWLPKGCLGNLQSVGHPTSLIQFYYNTSTYLVNLEKSQHLWKRKKGKVTPTVGLFAPPPLTYIPSTPPHPCFRFLFFF